MALGAEDVLGGVQHVVVVGGVVDVTDGVAEGGGLVNLAIVAATEEAWFEEFGCGGEVTGVLLVAEVAVGVVGRGGEGRLGPVEKRLFSLWFRRSGGRCLCVDLRSSGSGRGLGGWLCGGAVSGELA